MIEQAKTQQAERAKAATEEAAAAAAVKAVAEAEADAERLQVEEQMAAITLRMQSDALQLQQMRTRVGSSVVPPAAPHQDTEETMCVVCFDAPKQYAMLPCMHMCACETCAQRLMATESAHCPLCRVPIERTARVFF